MVLFFQGQVVNGSENTAHFGHLALNLPVFVPSSHALLIHRSFQFSLGWKDDLMVDDDCLNDLINMCLAGHRILVIWYGHQCGAKANSEIVGVHHVLIAVLGKTVENRTSKYHYFNFAHRKICSDETYWFRNANRYLMTMITGRGRVTIIC